ncbi:NADP-dependent L-serine/L-allo-threonine dehydrogenase YdfG [Candidatus Endolissoclinum faulkneri L5]|uniref:NADP-dependent L-serine/L-allo-threonine dehydrogenase YdfG n=1 Tax=Candidatus Endolissoclinum faulkneri L5 TaxID=1401328 RepID=V9TSS0_9PROT|nr:SDR family NAD(P)-dependent oxidoreductase [Candidatus Endolissoclinum faulkneri]AHC73641.1 NADP-dependent L-serine/L-allo-threonine dehydrogenase YdfG [Candidatus Endolissoclinum faulkneri L5]
MICTAKKVFITGATSGFGKAIAQRFDAEGWYTVISGRRSRRLETLKQNLLNPCHSIVLDVRNLDAVTAAVCALPDVFTPVDVLVNNAGLALGMMDADEVCIEDWELMVDTNIKGLLYCTRTILPQMVKRGSGHVVNIGSIAGYWPYPGSNVYGATKAFVRQFSLNLRADLVSKNIHVTDIEPGLAETEFSEVRFKGDKKKAADIYRDVSPIKPDDIADAVFWAVSRPRNININRIEIMAGAQAFSPLNIVRGLK